MTQVTVTEKEALQVLIVKYMTLTDAEREYARHKTKCMVEWQGAPPSARAFNKKVLAAMWSAEGDLKLAASVKSSIEPYTPPTFLEVAGAFKPIVYVIVCAGGVLWLGAVILQFIAGAAKQALAIGQAYGGWVVLGCFACLLLSMLPKIEWTRSGSGQTTHEKYEEETFYQKKSYEKTTNG